ncbi:hypothetical protein FNF27_05458 [Cafeteria roenbergensis]|uniref:Uncharacterized protein n=1 Tax=Cafeteria roenbergensis TaxID=33653 RepID=A0A5A8DP19_CAFRO|nr:hypothetical protein FNF29_05998 [Cafeteria roenbergensis]KAA0167112.1 hypothetical protein FNF31_00998 [Cafeteria roenbergensis]KAA0169339.1 hypothetical protein FNF28_02120 [Cafeteria roenbergensis]KAA0173109.1 hypothetical protein FNF27_05458 [Cafeteria roenbergensis]|eukprot:KAA0149445.1 hypothetical protein FNF29_05998 [Cafeteria roenbergensis]
MAKIPLTVGKAVYGKAAYNRLAPGAMREIGLGLAVGAGVGALWKMYHANDRFLTAQANKRWIDRKVELRSRAAAAADA